jgi:hypothetical protein
MGIEDFISLIHCLFYHCLQLQLEKFIFLLSSLSVFICTFCADRKYQRTLRMDAFLTKNVVDILWASGTRLAAQNGCAIFLT